MVIKNKRRLKLKKEEEEEEAFILIFPFLNASSVIIYTRVKVAFAMDLALL